MLKSGQSSFYNHLITSVFLSGRSFRPLLEQLTWSYVQQLFKNGGQIPVEEQGTFHSR